MATYSRALSIAVIALTAACATAPYVIPFFNAQQISCRDNSTPEMRQNMQADFVSIREAATHVQHGSKEEKLLLQKLLQTSKTLADSGNPYGMGFFGDALRTEVILEYLDQQHVTSKRQAPSITLPEELHKDVVTGLSYLYIAADTGGDPEEKAQNLVGAIQIPGVKAHDLPSNYVHVPHQWIAEAKANAKAWKKACKGTL